MNCLMSCELCSSSRRMRSGVFAGRFGWVTVWLPISMPAAATFWAVFGKAMMLLPISKKVIDNLNFLMVLRSSGVMALGPSS